VKQLRTAGSRVFRKRRYDEIMWDLLERRVLTAFRRYANPCLYVTNTYPNNSVTVYASGATGNASPIRTIIGSNTGLNNPVDIAVNRYSLERGHNCKQGIMSVLWLFRRYKMRLRIPAT
jgi:hypothetical protein